MIPARPAPKGRAYAQITFVNVMWGLSFIASKYAMQQGFGAFTLAFVRYVFVCITMLPVLRLKEGSLHLPQKKDLPAVILSGVSGITLYLVCEYTGVMRTTAANASLMLAVVPALSIVWGAIRGKRYAPVCWLGVAVSLAGVSCVAYFGAAEAGGTLNATVLLGNLLLLGACVCWVAYVEISNRLLTRYSSLNLTTWQGVAGLIALAPLALLESPNWQPVPISAWLSVLFLALVCSAVCFFLYAQAIRNLSPMQAAIFINLNPIVTAIAGAAFLGESITAMQLVGGLLIIGSILLVNYGMREPAL